MLVVIYTESREWEIHEIVLTLLICFLVALSLLLIKAFMHCMIAFFSLALIVLNVHSQRLEIYPYADHDS